MKEFFSISAGSNVAKAKPISDSKTISSNDQKKSPSNDFLSIMFAQIKEGIKNLDKSGKLAIDTSVKEAPKEHKFSSDDSKKSLDNHLLGNILEIVSLLKNGVNEKSSFPKYSNKIEKLINNEQALKELKNVKNLTDLLKLSKKYDLGLSKVSVDKLDMQSLQKEFPKLSEKSFFDLPKEKASNEINVKKELNLKPTTINISNIEKPKETKSISLFEKAIEHAEVKKPIEHVEVKKPIEHVEVKKPIEHVEVKKPIEHVEVKKPIEHVEVKKPIEITTNINKKETQVNVKNENIEIKKAEIKNNEITEIKKIVEIVQKEVDKKGIPITEIKANDKKNKYGRTAKNEINIEQKMLKKGLIESIIQNIKPIKNEPIHKAIDTAFVKPDIKIDTTNQNDSNNDIKNETLIHKTELKSPSKFENIGNKNLINHRSSLNSFANDLREKIENYKPPLMKIQLALNPKELGAVDVTLVNRGNSLHVNITANTNTMSLFTQNQAEFKNSLVNMGFTNLEMNFSDQRESNQQQNQNNKQNKNRAFDETQNQDNFESTVELIVPKYI